MNKKLLSLVLALVMCLGLCVPAFATVETNTAEGVPNMKYFYIEVGETEGKDREGNIFQLSNPVIRIEEKDVNGNTYTCSVIPVGTTVTVVKADGTKPENMWVEGIEGSGENSNPFTIKTADYYGFSCSAADTLATISVEADETKPDDAKPDETKPDAAKPDATKPDAAKPDETKPDDAKPDETKPDDAKPDETKPDETKPDDAKPDETKPDDAKPDDEKPEETKPVENPFTDVKEDDYFYGPVLWAVEKKITNGTTETTFTPERECVVSEILTFLWRAAGSPEATIENPYTDGTENAWYADAAIWAHEQGMVTGETFPADEPCTRAATAVYLWQAAGSPEVEEAAEFTDVAADADYAAAVAWAVENAVTTGTSETTFSPDNTCTRGQIATFLFRAYEQQ